jgi:ubiquinone/menaquinone biosynthesis C-methylase UbiE
MPDSPDPWNQNYNQKGKLWAGTTRDLPSPARGAMALELGCGNGKTLAGLLVKGWEVTGLDSSSQAVTLCRTTLPETSRARLVVADTRTLPFCDASFDLVLLIHVLGHLDHAGRKQTVDECARILKDNGTILFRDFSTQDFRFGRGLEIEAGSFQRGNGILTHYFSRDEIISLFPLTAESITASRWFMRVRGTDMVREEIDAVFYRTSPQHVD